MMKSSKRQSSVRTIVKRLTLGIVIAIPLSVPCWVECYTLGQRIDELHATTIAVTTQKDRSPRLAKRLDADRKRLLELRANLVSENEISGLQDHLVLLVREAGCQLRKIRAGQTSKRKWNENDDPLAPATDKSRPTGFELQTTPIMLSVVGAMPAVLEFVQKLHDEPRFEYMRRLDVAPDGPNSDVVSMSVDILVFDFRQVAAISFDEAL